MKVSHRIRVEFTREIKTGRLHFGVGETWDTWTHRITDDDLDLEDATIPSSHFRVVARWHPSAAAPPLTHEQHLAHGRMCSHDPEGYARRMMEAQS